MNNLSDDRKAGWTEKLRLLRKRWWNKSHSQLGEDFTIAAVFEGQSQGVYVDVGCFHPRKYSNTYALYKKGWRGVNIDISPHKIALFDFDRPEDKNICCAASDTTGELRAFIFGSGSALDTTEPEVAREWAEKFNKPYRETIVPCRPLTDILADCGITGFDYLNIDAEGAELSVLSGLDFSRFSPKCISVEIHGDIEGVMKSPSYLLLLDKGYDLFSWIRPTCIFSRKETSG